jgi:hypothetical protein
VFVKFRERVNIGKHVNTRNFALIGLLSLGIQACTIAQAQYSLSRDDFKNLRATNGDSSPNVTAPSAQQSPQEKSTQDSKFSTKFNRALSDAKRKEHEAQADSLRAQMQSQEMRDSTARSQRNNHTNTSTGRTQIQFDGNGATACRKMESGQTRCAAQGQR